MEKAHARQTAAPRYSAQGGRQTRVFTAEDARALFLRSPAHLDLTEVTKVFATAPAEVEASGAERK